MMVKSDYQKAAESKPSRRGFLTRVWTGLGILAFVEFIGVSVAFLRPRKLPITEGEFGSVITAGPIDDFALNSVTAFIRGHFYLSRLDDGGFLALSSKCTHLGCTVPWVSTENRFVCPCHASTFDITGNVISPPAPRALDLYPIIIENDIVKVDTRKSIKRTGFREDQVVYPKKI